MRQLWWKKPRSSTCSPDCAVSQRAVGCAVERHTLRCVRCLAALQVEGVADLLGECCHLRVEWNAGGVRNPHHTSNVRRHPGSIHQRRWTEVLDHRLARAASGEGRPAHDKNYQCLPAQPGCQRVRHTVRQAVQPRGSLGTMCVTTAPGRRSYWDGRASHPPQVPQAPPVRRVPTLRLDAQRSGRLSPPRMYSRPAAPSSPGHPGPRSSPPACQSR